MSAIDRLNPASYSTADRWTFGKRLLHAAGYAGTMTVGMYVTARGFGESAVSDTLPVRAGETLAGIGVMSVAAELAGRKFLAPFRERTLASQAEQPPLPPGEPAE